MGTYHLGRRLVAASGVVEAYLGSRDDRWLVLSRLSAPWSQDATLLDRFGGPSRALATVYSDEVATLLEYGHGGDGFWLAESTGDGEPLRALMTSRVGRLSTGEAVAIAERVATALDALHGATTPVVHGDVSASSTFISSAGGVQLLHAGLACVAGAHPSRGPARSEPHAIAPEQLDGAPSSQTDVFRLGLLLLELLTGRSPYAETAPQQVLDHARQYQGLPACALEGVPDQLRVVLSLMMHRDPVHRPPASEVLSALQMAASALDLATGAEEVALAFHRLMSDRQPPMAARTTELRLTPPKMNTPPPVLPRPSAPVPSPGGVVVARLGTRRITADELEAVTSAGSPLSPSSPPPGRASSVDGQLGERLVRAGAVTPEQLAEARARAAENGVALATVLSGEGGLDEDVVTEALAAVTRTTFVSRARLDKLVPASAVLARLSRADAERLGAVPVAEKGQGLIVAVVDPLDPEVLAAVRAVAPSMTVHLVRSGPRALNHTLARLFGERPPRD